MTTLNNNVDFEDGLRHILTPDAVLPGGLTTAGITRKVGAFPGAATRKLQAAASKLEADQKRLKIFKIIRAVAIIVLVFCLAYFAHRIATISPRRSDSGAEKNYFYSFNDFYNLGEQGDGRL